MKRKIQCLLTVILASLCGMSQITSYPVNDTILVNGSITYDFNADAAPDITFEIITLSPGVYAARVITSGFSRMLDNSTFGYPDTLNYGNPVTGYFHTGTGVLGTFNNAGQFNGAGDKYFGMKISASGNDYVGWVKLNCNFNRDSLRIISVGYCTVPSVTINAGQTSVSGTTEFTDILPGLIVFPNPGRGVLRLDIVEGRIPEGEMDVLNSAGQVVLSFVPSGFPAEIDLTGMPPGVYIARLRSAYGGAAVRIVVE